MFSSSGAGGLEIVQISVVTLFQIIKYQSRSGPRGPILHDFEMNIVIVTISNNRNTQAAQDPEEKQGKGFAWRRLRSRRATGYSIYYNSCMISYSYYIYIYIYTSD